MIHVLHTAHNMIHFIYSPQYIKDKYFTYIVYDI